MTTYVDTEELVSYVTERMLEEGYLITEEEVSVVLDIEMEYLEQLGLATKITQ